MPSKPKKRPQALDSLVLENVVSRLLPSVRTWLEEQGNVISDKDEQGVFDVLIELLHHQGGRWDGYELARALEDQEWRPDSTLVEILNDSRRTCLHCLREATIRWAADGYVELTHKEGESVWFQLYPKEPSMCGQIVELHPETLEYSVLVNDISLLVPEEAIDKDEDLDEGLV